jgi:Protein of unknown function (DUF3558)
MRRSGIAGVLVALSVAIAGCSGGSASEPSASSQQPGSPPSSSTAAGLPHSGAPPVRDPLPESVLAGNPCDEALTVTQVKAALGKTVVGEPGRIATGATCVWQRVERGSSVGVGYITETHEGLSAVYANTRPQSRVWRPLPPIQGFPAVAHAGGIKQFCAVSVGLADNLSVDISAILGFAKEGEVDPCDVTAQIADMVVTNLRKKGGE